MKKIPKIMKPIDINLASITKNKGTTICYGNGYDKLNVTLGELRGNGYRDYSIETVDEDYVEAIFTDSELREYIEEQLYGPIENRYSIEDFERICKEKGSIHGVVRLSFYDFHGFPDPEYVLLKSLVDISARGTHGVKVKYEVVGFEDKYIYVMVIAELSAENH